MLRKKGTRLWVGVVTRCTGLYRGLKSDWNCEQAQLNLLRFWSMEDGCSPSPQAVSGSMADWGTQSFLISTLHTRAPAHSWRE